MAKSSASSGKNAAVDLVDPAATLPADMSYEQALSELEGLVMSMESGQLPLDSLLSSYQRGAQLLKFCRSRLEAVESQVKLLEAGQLKPLDAV